MARDDMIKIGAFWERETLKGDKFLSGTSFDKGRLIMFRNGFKEKDNQPDWILYIQPQRRKEEESERESGEEVFDNPKLDEVDDDDSVPF